MKCERCNENPATVRMTRIVDGNKTETNLCEECARKENPAGFGLDPKWMLHNIFADLFNQPLAGSQQAGIDEAKPVKCEQCGFTELQFSRVGKLGCPKCYDKFASKLEPVLRRVHGNPRHTGKIPKRSGASLGIRKEIGVLKLRLQEAVNREEYEIAAQIRDQIRTLESQIG